MKKLTALLIAAAAILSLGSAALADDADTEAAEGTEQQTGAAAEETSQPQTVTLYIDDENVYEGMTKAYKDGYVPAAENGTVTLVLPLLATGSLQADQLIVTPRLGDTSTSPIQYKNYQKTFFLTDNAVEGSDQTVSGYLVTFDFPLRDDRKNGTYPVTLDVQGTNPDGTALSQSFTCYISVTDEPVETAGAVETVVQTVTEYVPVSGGEETPDSQPKIVVKATELDAEPVTAGDEFTATVTLWNTSDTQNVQNMTVTVACDCANFVLLNDSDTIFIDSLKAGAATNVEIKYKTDLETPAARYAVSLAMSYDNSDAVSLASQGSFLVEVAQPLRVELSPVTLESSVNAGETMQLSYQVMNLGRTGIYNVRVEMDVPGLIPGGTAFVGNMDAGTDATVTQDVFVGSKDMSDSYEGDERYGYTYGTVTLVYEDAAGNEYTEETDVSTTINELVIGAEDTSEEEAQARAVQWWVFVIVGAVVLAGLGVLVYIRCGRRAKVRR